MKREVHMMMVYCCDKCGDLHQIWLEKGLEEEYNQKLNNPSGLPHKPVPYIIQCPKCGELTMRHMIGADVFLSDFEELKDGNDIFINSKKSDCGKPVFNYKG